MSKGNTDFTLNNPFKYNKDTQKSKQDQCKSLFSDLALKDRPQMESVFSAPLKNPGQKLFGNDPAPPPNPFKQELKASEQSKPLFANLFANSQSIFDSNQQSSLFKKQESQTSSTSITIYPMAVSSIFSSKQSLMQGNRQTQVQSQHNHMLFRCSGCEKTFIKKDLFTNNIGCDKEASKLQVDKLQMEGELRRKDNKIIKLQEELNKLRQSIDKKTILAEFISRKWRDLSQWQEDSVFLVESVKNKSSTLGKELQAIIIQQQRELLQTIKERLHATSDIFIQHLTAFQKNKQIESECTRKLYAEIKKDLEGRVSEYEDNEKLEVGTTLTSGVMQHFVKEIVAVDQLLASVDSLKKQAEKLKTHIKTIS